MGNASGTEPPSAFDRARSEMVARQLRSRDITDAVVIDAMATVPREVFVPKVQRRHAYEDRPLPIEDGQTISQPYIVALMAQEARVQPGDRVLEIGAGSGYGAAVLAQLGASVVTVERIAHLASRARQRLADAGVAGVEVVVADGTLGWPPGAPYDAVIVTAGGPRVPDELVAQLRPGGRLVAPVGDRVAQRLVRVVPDAAGGMAVEDLGGVAFVPLVGEQGWPE